MKNQIGFTLIELVIVIVILGILSAYALPKFMSIDKEARISVVQGLSGSIKAASDMVHSVAIAKGVAGPSNVEIAPGELVTIGANQYPTADTAGIQAALASTHGFTSIIAVTIMTFTKDGAPDPTNCNIVYDASSILGAPVISFITTGC